MKRMAPSNRATDRWTCTCIRVLVRSPEELKVKSKNAFSVRRRRGAAETTCQSGAGGQATPVPFVVRLSRRWMEMHGETMDGDAWRDDGPSMQWLSGGGGDGRHRRGLARRLRPLGDWTRPIAFASGQAAAGWQREREVPD